VTHEHGPKDLQAREDEAKTSKQGSNRPEEAVGVNFHPRRLNMVGSPSNLGYGTFPTSHVRAPRRSPKAAAGCRRIYHKMLTASRTLVLGRNSKKMRTAVAKADAVVQVRAEISSATAKGWWTS
jgi:hypothetical protein